MVSVKDLFENFLIIFRLFCLSIFSIISAIIVLLFFFSVDKSWVKSSCWVRFHWVESPCFGVISTIKGRAPLDTRHRFLVVLEFSILTFPIVGRRVYLLSRSYLGPNARRQYLYMWWMYITLSIEFTVKASNHREVLAFSTVLCLFRLLKKWNPVTCGSLRPSG